MIEPERCLFKLKAQILKRRLNISSKAIAIVPARAGSKGLPNKNVKELAGKPLFRHSVDAAIEAGFTTVYISTDIDDIFLSDLPDNVVVVRRPAGLTGDDVLMADVLLNVISTNGLEDTTVTLLQPTSPLRKAETIKHAMKIFDENDYSLVMSVCEAPSVVLKWGTIDGDQFRNISDPKFCFMNRQSLPVVFRPNGAIYTFSAQQFLYDKGFSTRSIGVVRMLPEESYDIDTLEDFHKCEMIIRKGEEL